MKKWILISILALSAIVCNLSTPAPKPASSNGNAMETLAAMASATAAAQSTPETGTTGTIMGKLSYPADSLPAMRVAAFEVNTGEIHSTDTVLGQATYAFDLPAGTYHIVAYSIASGAFPGGIASGYTRAVTCGLAPECADHTLIDVVIAGGASLSDINPGDSYAPEGTFPPMPGQ